MNLALSEHLPLIAAAPDGIQKLRGLIFELAIRGKLLSQDQNYETVDLPLDETREITTPFPIPGDWTWVPLKEVATKITDGEHISPKKTLDGMMLLTAKHVLEKGVSLANPQYVSVEDGLKFRERCAPSIGDVLICSRGTIGRCCVVNTDALFCLMGSVILVRPESKLVPGYLNVFLKSDVGQKFIRGITKGMAVNALYLKDIRQCLIPLPPLATQHQIVAKVDELMALCDRLESEQNDSATAHAQLVETLLGSLTQSTDASDFEANWKRIAEHFDMLFTTESSIDILKQTIMQLAIMGKLVPQVSTDEPVAALLMRLANGSEKTKSILEVSVDEHPFATPDSWAWGRVATLGKTQTGTTPSKSQPGLFGTDYPFIKPGDISVAGSMNYDNEGLSSEGATSSGRLADPNSILMVCIGTIGKCGQIDRHCSFNQQINSVTPMEGTSDFALIALRSPYFQNEAWHRSSSTTLSILNKGKWESIPIPIPPLPEQIRIASRVDELFQKLEQLRCQITQQLALTSGLTNQLLASS